MNNEFHIEKFSSYGQILFPLFEAYAKNLDIDFLLLQLSEI